MISGKIDAGETIEEAVAREVKEETGWKIDNLIPSYVFKKNDFTLYAIEEGIQHPEDASLLFIREKYCLLKVEREGGAYQEVD
jgi:8-oxo-dGTP pyrophosphatase MutT (NUDIX family)